MKSPLPYTVFLEIEWTDATSNDGWVDVGEEIDIEHIVTRGWLIKETEVYVTLAGSIYKKDAKTVGSTMTIPVGMIVSRRELRITNARRKL